ncbi:MAG: hypothetical protein ACI9MS_001498 [Glaciecola sp.]|jgi:hypothetical protein
MCKNIAMLVKLSVFMPLTLLQPVISPRYKGIETDTANFSFTGRLRTNNGSQFINTIFNRSDTWI